MKLPEISCLKSPVTLMKCSWIPLDCLGNHTGPRKRPRNPHRSPGTPLKCPWNTLKSYGTPIMLLELPWNNPGAPLKPANAPWDPLNTPDTDFNKTTEMYLNPLKSTKTPWDAHETPETCCNTFGTLLVVPPWVPPLTLCNNPETPGAIR